MELARKAKLRVPIESQGGLAWLRERERAITERVRAEDDPSSGVSRTPADRRARRDALAVIRRWIADLESADREVERSFSSEPKQGR